MKVIDDPKDPVFVAPSRRVRRLVLRIGERKRGQSRNSAFTTDQARKLGIALISMAEERDEAFLQAALYAGNPSNRSMQQETRLR
jgi:hypothetical protein